MFIRSKMFLAPENGDGSGGGDGGDGGQVADATGKPGDEGQKPEAKSEDDPEPKPKPKPKPEAKPKPKPEDDTTAAELEALKAKVAEQGQALESARAAMRDQVLEQLGVKEKYRGIAPADADATTQDGKRALEKWASENPELLDRSPASTSSAKPVDMSKVKNPALVHEGRWNKARGVK